MNSPLTYPDQLRGDNLAEFFLHWVSRATNGVTQRVGR
jgi:hypothetical protein